jgi:alkane 1-monooxygenase
MLRYLLNSLALHFLIGATFGAPGVLLFVLQAVVSVGVLEIINYVEHYGLTRREVAPGRYERVLPQHSWNSDHRISNWLLFNVPRHSHHHIEPRLAYASIQHIEDAPQLPAGYFAMFILALFPPLWRRIMDPLVRCPK